MSIQEEQITQQQNLFKVTLRFSCHCFNIVEHYTLFFWRGGGECEDVIGYSTGYSVEND